MKLLLVEDDENKRGAIRAFLECTFPRCEVVDARSYQSGIRFLLAGRWDLVVLDMTLPTFDIGPGEDGGRPQPFGGREILRQIHRRRSDACAVVVTQFDRFGEGAETKTLAQLDEELKQRYAASYLGAVFYDVTAEGWKEKLAEIIDVVRNRGSGT